MLPPQKGGSARGDGVYTAARAEEREPRAVPRPGRAPTPHFIRTLHGPEGSPPGSSLPRSKSNPTPLTSLQLSSQCLWKDLKRSTLIKARLPSGRDRTTPPEGEFQSNAPAGFLGSDGLGVWTRARITANLYSAAPPKDCPYMGVAVGVTSTRGLLEQA